MILANGNVMCSDFKLRRCDIEIDGEKIVRIGESLSGNEKIDLDGKYVLPGFIDTHIHGAHGSRIDDHEPDVKNITRFEATQGVTSLAITVAGSAPGILRECDAAYAAHIDPCGAKIAAIHCEGPFLNEKRKGAMSAKNIILPENEILDAMLEHAKGLLKIISVAPEVEGGIEFTKYAVSRGVAVSMGHTDATYDEAKRAIEAGASRMTHTFNAARPINHREPGVLGAALTDPRVDCEMICDLVHLHEATIKLIYAAKGADKICIISDSSAAAGLDVTEFEVGGVKRYIKDGVIRLADGTIAGSV